MLSFSKGLYRADTNDGTRFAPTLEKLISRIEPQAPPEKIAHAAEVLEPHVRIGQDLLHLHEGVVST